MTIGLFSAKTEKVRKCFRLLKEIQQQIIALNIPNVEMKELSMGMSGDMETAIAEGATVVRVGTAILGQRIYPDSYYWNEKQSQRTTMCIVHKGFRGFRVASPASIMCANLIGLKPAIPYDTIHSTL